MALNLSKNTVAFSTTTLGALRIAVGAATLLAPMQSAALFGAPTNPASKIIVRLFGIRDLVLGFLLWSARPRKGSCGKSSTSGEDNTTLRRALWSGLVTDAVDVCSCTLEFLDGTIGQRAMISIGGGAVSFVLLALIGLGST